MNGKIEYVSFWSKTEIRKYEGNSVGTAGNSIDMRNFMKNEIASFERIFNISEKGFKVNAELNIRSIVGKSQVKENEHLIEILKGTNMEKGDIGEGDIG